MMFLLFSACTFVSDDEWAGRSTSCVLEGFYLDLDGDGFGGQPVRDCDELEGALPRAGDCNDVDATINPGVDEVYYDELDANCDGLDDDDADLDGYASARFGGADCYDDPAVDAVPAAVGDCELPSDDISADRIHPGATDVLYDGVDADCSGGTDFDGDGDGFRSCDECADTDADVNPEVQEVWYDGIDQNCDENDGDQDGDGYVVAGYVEADPGNPIHVEGAYGVDDCWDDLADIPPGYDATNGMAQPSAAAVHPDAIETWYDGVDQDCAGNDDFDQDGDGYNSTDDCDDDDATRSPSAPEDCDIAGDDNCDGDDNDADAVRCTTWHQDADADSLGSVVASQCRCSAVGDFNTKDSRDCDDADASIGELTWYQDDDADGYGAAASVSSCTEPAGYASAGDDCDDSDGSAYPGATEACDAVDSDCDGEVNDAEVIGLCTTTWYADVDGDGYGGEGVCLCAAEAPYTGAIGGDCDDADGAVSPAAAEVCNDGVDSDCDDAPGPCAFGGSKLSGDAELSWFGASAADLAGVTISAGGDLDGDGLDELLVGATGYDAGSASYWGMVSALRPGVDLAMDAGAFQVVNDNYTAEFGGAFAAPGDVDGDGADDLLVGFPNTVDYTDSAVLLFRGVGAGYASVSSADLVLLSGNASRPIGGVVASPGDLDGDGFAEILVGVPYDPSYGDGSVLVMDGSVTGTWFVESVVERALYGNGDSRFGTTLATGDVDGDGMSDTFVGAPAMDRSATDDGAVLGYFGSFGSVGVGGADFLVGGAAADCAFGALPPVVADVDDDGYGEVSAACSAGDVYVIPGTSSYGTLAQDVAYATLSAGGVRFGEALAAGDLDDDGRVDLVIGAPGADAAYVYAGPLASGVMGTASASASLTASTAGTDFGAAVAVLRDADGDSIGDLTIGAPLDDSAGVDAGAVYFFAGGGY
ncbi:MAG: hypothetical protein EXR71_01530 [Myxococcales bacterium]|nr:hypothetical protein [Myxococcales bacterium]